MRLFGVAMIRDEADVVEAFVRHNLTILDGLAIVDHGSLDGTSDILLELKEEGLPIVVKQTTEAGFFQSRHLTALAREMLTRERADFVFALDADEFLKVSSRAALEGALAAVPPGMNVLLHWLTYVPDDFESDAFGPGHLWWRLKVERHAVHKIAVSRGMLERPSMFITDGNHAVAEPGAATPPRLARLPADVAAVAHCPVRSCEQLSAKVVTGYLADLAAQGPGKPFAHHWLELYQEIRGGGTITPERLREVACNYPLPRARWRPVEEIELTEDPVPVSFELRHRRVAAPDTLRRVMRFAEALIAQRSERPSPAIVII